jgi:hypothetical protein
MARKLVVVGNGMAGVRAPDGNHNRILLSNVLAGSDDSAEIYLNALDWYADNDIDLPAGVRVVRFDRYARILYTNDGSARKPPRAAVPGAHRRRRHPDHDRPSLTARRVCRVHNRLATVVIARTHPMATSDVSVGISGTFTRWPSLMKGSVFSCSACNTSLMPMNARMNASP